jgi:hypothetical protein
MKIITLIAVFIMLGVNALAQTPKVVAEITASSERFVKNAPFSADAISESVQTLADGNRIVRSSTSKLYRNSEGRFRREMAPGTGGALGSLYTYGHGVTLIDPVGGYRYMIDTNLKTARQTVMRPKGEITIVSGTASGQGGIIDTSKLREEIKAAAAAGQTGVIVDHKDGKITVEKLKEEIKAVAAAAPALAAQAMTGQIMGDTMVGFGAMHSVGLPTKYESRTEELGTQNIEGVDAEGTRTTMTIPAGAIGNERAIEVVYEKWYSRELQLVVMSKHNDPRFGEQTYRLTNIVRSEPDPSLFTLPSGYRLITEPGRTYTVSPKASITYEKATGVKAAQAPAAVKGTKP